MHLLDGSILGITILVLLGMLVIVKRMATGSILDKPKGNGVVQLVNISSPSFTSSCGHVALGGLSHESIDRVRWFERVFACGDVTPSPLRAGVVT